MDYKKAFDSVNWDSMRKILFFYCFPTQLVEVIKSLCKSSEYAVNINGNLSDWFKVTSGVRQGCVLSPLLFSVIIDWIMRTCDKEKSVRDIRDVHQEILKFH